MNQRQPVQYGGSPLLETRLHFSVPEKEQEQHKSGGKRER